MTYGPLLHAATQVKKEEEGREFFFLRRSFFFSSILDDLFFLSLSKNLPQVLFEGVPTFPDAGRMWQIVEKHGVTQLYTVRWRKREREKKDFYFFSFFFLSLTKIKKSSSRKQIPGPNRHPRARVPGRRLRHPLRPLFVTRLGFRGRAHRPPGLEVVPRRRRRQ